MPNVRAGREDCERVAQAIKLRRMELGWTQEQLADESGVSLRTVQNAEGGGQVIQELTRARLENALKLSRGHLTRLYFAASSAPLEPEVALNGRAQKLELLEMISEPMLEVLQHPKLSPEARRVIMLELRSLQSEYAEKCREFFRLQDELH